MTLLHKIKLENTAKYYAVADGGATFKKGDRVIIRRDFFQDHGLIIDIGEGDPALLTDFRKSTEPPRIVRLQTPEDAPIIEENTKRARETDTIVRSIVQDLKLPMKVLNVMYSFDGKICTVQFSAENRVDFRELLKVLASTLNCRIDLRQVSVRDEAAAIGGLGCCGATLCCVRFLSEFASINVKMAKDQNIALGSNGISGVCGRLKCCLKYEHETYIELQKNMPQRGDICLSPEGEGRVCDRNVLSRRVSIVIEDNSGYHIAHFHNENDKIKIVKRNSYSQDDSNSK